MTWVKVCGITTEMALDAAVSAGADAIGLVIIDASPRHLEVARAAELADGCPIDSYLLVADEEAERAMWLVDRVGATGIQPYGAHAGATTRVALERGLRVLVPVPVGGTGGVELAGVPAVAMPLLDAADDVRLGGTGRTFDWRRIGTVGREFVLAGGLGPDNVAAAIHAVRPFGVDASSRLESEPGVKDPDTIRAFVQEAKAT